MNGLQAAKHPTVMLAATVVTAFLLNPLPSSAQVTNSELDEASRLFSDGAFEQSAEAHAALLQRLSPEQSHLRPSLLFNQGCALLASGKPDLAAERLFAADSAAADPALRAASRYNLGRIESDRASSLAGQDRAAAIEAYRRAERFFRNALPEQPAGSAARADTARNIEAVQRRIARLLEEQKQEQEQQRQQQQDQPNNPQNQPDQQNPSGSDPKPSENKPPQDQQQPRPDQGSQQQKDQQQSSSGSEQHDPSQAQPEDQPPQQPGQERPPPDVEQQKREAGADQDARPVDIKPGDRREFDRVAAEILDKERKQRERIRQMIRQMMQRAAPVEKDW